MIWTGGLTTSEKNKRNSKFKKWFAWYPITVGYADGHKIKAWFQYVMRKRIRGYWRYILIKEQEK